MLRSVKYSVRRMPLLVKAGIASLIIFVIVIYNFTSVQDTAVSQYRRARLATNPLSPPGQAYMRTAHPGKDANGKRIPPPVVHYYMNNVTTTGTPIENRETILILTPLARFYEGYWDNLLKLSYPHELITLGFIIPKNREGNQAAAALQDRISHTQLQGPEKLRFGSIIIERQDFDPPLASQDEAERHKISNQFVRRSAMSRARNSLLFTTLGPSTSWVLWLDGDVVETPASLIQDLASHDQAIIVPNCFQRYTDPSTKKLAERPYDFNSWQDSETAKQMASKMGKDEIIVEGYSEMATYRSLMAYAAREGESESTLMPLDGVGGTALLVKAEVHRDGAMFPPFAFYHLIETEGFAKMARRLGYKSWGLPNYKVNS